LGSGKIIASLANLASPASSSALSPDCLGGRPIICLGFWYVGRIVAAAFLRAASWDLSERHDDDHGRTTQRVRQDPKHIVRLDGVILDAGSLRYITADAAVTIAEISMRQLRALINTNLE
jgi:hypothetical protein